MQLSPIRAACPAHLILGLITRITFSEENNELAESVNKYSNHDSGFCWCGRQDTAMWLHTKKGLAAERRRGGERKLDLRGEQGYEEDRRRRTSSAF
jgi:hypothetical protein